MIISDPNGDGILFSRSCSDLTIMNIPETSREVSLQLFSGDRQSSFKATQFGGKVIIRLCEILRGLDAGSVFDIDQTNGITLSSPHRIDIYASAGDDSATWQGWFVDGGSDLGKTSLSELFGGRYWWSFRKQSAPTFKFSKEIMVAAVKNSSRVSISVTFHFAQAGKVTWTWHSNLNSTSSNPKLMFVDCSFRKVREFADTLGYVNDTIIAYDITGTADADGYPVGQRFIVAPNDSRVRGWCFRNSLGGYDTVYSYGAVTRSIDSETKVFSAGRTSTELENYSDEVWNIDTGYIADKRDLELWYEFLRSKERYAISPDGSLIRILVDESDSDLQSGKLGSMTFKCRFAKETSGYDFTKPVLEDFSDEFT